MPPETKPAPLQLYDTPVEGFDETVVVAVSLVDVRLSPVQVKIGKGLTVKVPEADVAHPFESVTVTVYDPPVDVVMEEVVAPVFQLYVYGDVPPVTDAVSVPLLPAQTAAGAMLHDN